MDPHLARLEDEGYDVTRNPDETRRREHRRRLLRGLVVLLVVAAVPVGLAVTDEVQQRRVDASLPDLAAALGTLVAEHPAQVPSVAAGEAAEAPLPWSDAVSAWEEDPPLEPLPVGEPGLVDPAEGGSVLACVRWDPWWGAERDRCVPVDAADAAPSDRTGGRVFYALSDG